MITATELAEKVIDWASLEDDSDIPALAEVCGATVAYVSTLPVVKDSLNVEVPPSVELGMVMLASRLYRRRNSPIGIDSFTADGGVVVWIVADATIRGSETGTSFRQTLCAIECGFNLHDTMIWTKPNPIPRTHSRYEQQFEYMFIWSKGKPKSWNGLRAPSKYAGAKRGGTIQMDASGRRKQKNTDGVISSTKLIGNVW